MRVTLVTSLVVAIKELTCFTSSLASMIVYIMNFLHKFLQPPTLLKHVIDISKCWTACDESKSLNSVGRSSQEWRKLVPARAQPACQLLS